MQEHGKDSPGRFRLVTMGCRVNHFETARLRRWALEAGLREQEEGPVDLVVVNTCTVTGESDRQARQLIRRLVREHPQARVVVTGCYARRAPDQLAALEGVHQVVGHADKAQAQHWFRSPGNALTLPWPQAPLGPSPDGTSAPLEMLEGTEDRARAHLQVQQGCDAACTFCIIPQVRGPSRSVPGEQVLARASALVQQGWNELVLTGINLGAYGREGHGAAGLAALLESLLAQCGTGVRLRLSSLDPADVDDDLVAVFARHSALCPFVHLSMQSGDDLILKRMGRRHDAARVRQVCARLRAARPEMAFGADVIVGFPTESDTAFHNTLALVRDEGIAFCHVFRYSDRPGTPAARIPQSFRVDDAVMRQRSALLRAQGEANLRGLLQQRVGQVGEIVVETLQDGHAFGRDAAFLPVHVPTGQPLPRHGQRLAVRYVGLWGDEAALAAQGLRDGENM
ncbi:MAG: tRNA (N(6)-L-threonylcarbamoyladenosine(37)-C(2))-methylthiotransferase MtaB [Magnetococcus sp. WYHC-3]